MISRSLGNLIAKILRPFSYLAQFFHFVLKFVPLLTSGSNVDNFFTESIPKRRMESLKHDLTEMSYKSKSHKANYTGVMLYKARQIKAETTPLKNAHT